MVATLETTRPSTAPVSMPRRALWLRIVDPVRLLPATVAYTLLLVLVGGLLASANVRVQNAVVDHASTNLHNLLRGHWGTLVVSAFITAEPVWTTVPVLVCALALAELRFGTRRMVGTFLAGHIGATLIVALGLVVAVAAGWMSSVVMNAADVGVSYGGMAIVGALLALLPTRWRRYWIVSWIVLAAIGIALGRTFTNVGHFVALLIGLAVGAALLFARRGAAGRPLSRLDRGLLWVTCALGLCFLLG